MGDEAPAPHVLMISFPGQGHVNPLLRLAKRLASKGLSVTFSSTSDIGQKIVSSSGSPHDDRGVSVGRGRLRFEFMTDEWNIDDSRKSDIDELMIHLNSAGPKAFADLIHRQAEAGRPVSCVINNPFLPWAVDVATDMGIPSGVLWVQSCAVFSIYYHCQHSLVEFPSESNPDVSVSIPGLPTMAPDDMPSFLLPSSPYKSLRKVILEQFRNIDKASWVFANSFADLEQEAINTISKLSPLIPVGPLVEPDDESKSTVRGDLMKAADCIEWLDKQAPLSVAYVSVGSVVILTKEEMAEMAYGLKMSGRPFLWVVRDDSRALLPEGFLEEVSGVGMVVGWSPQDSVLAHRSVGCFLTHCGWNSTLEAITAGMPVVAYPQWGDQVTDAKFLVDVYKVGARIRAPVTRDALREAIDAVMDGKDSEGMRSRASKLKEAARAAMAEGGNSDRNIQDFVDELRRKACGLTSHQLE